MFKVFLFLSIFQLSVFANEVLPQTYLMYTWVGITTLFISLVGYYLVVLEPKTKMDKSVPALFIGVFLFIFLAAYFYINNLDIGLIEAEANNVILEIAEIFFFLFVAMTYIETLVYLNVFERLKYRLVAKDFTYKKIFWLSGFAAFFISPLADNLTTALVMSTILITIERQNKEFLIPAAINIVVASNAGGAWSPFGDITTIMAWTSGKGSFYEFLMLFPASFIGYLISAYLLSMLVPNNKPDDIKSTEFKEMKKGSKTVMFLGVFTILCSVVFYHYFLFSALWGMMFGLALLQLYSYYLKRKYGDGYLNVFDIISKIDHNTLMFFFGVLAVVGALYFTGWLSLITLVYEPQNLGATYSNIILGILSAFVDSVPVMSAVLRANPDMDMANWLLLTLSVGIGGSLISFGSAAGIAVMGRLRGIYTFQAHLKYTWMILLGYFASIFIWYIQFNVLN